MKKNNNNNNEKVIFRNYEIRLYLEYKKNKQKKKLQYKILYQFVPNLVKTVREMLLNHRKTDVDIC